MKSLRLKIQSNTEDGQLINLSIGCMCPLSTELFFLVKKNKILFKANSLFENLMVGNCRDSSAFLPSERCVNFPELNNLKAEETLHSLQGTNYQNLSLLPGKKKHACKTPFGTCTQKYVFRVCQNASILLAKII